MITAAMFALVVSSSHTATRTNTPGLQDLEHRAVNFFWEQSNPANGFSKDRATNSDKVDDHAVASCASVGFALTAYVIGAEKHWIPRAVALERTRVTISHVLAEWPEHRGWLYHFVDWKTGARIWNCEASTIDTSICLAGVIAAEQYWHDPQITRDSAAFTKRIDWNYMVTNDGKIPAGDTICMGWKPEDGFINSRWDNWDELKMIYVQGYGASDMPTTGWTKITRPLIGYKGIPMLTGGPLFMHEMSESFYSFSNLRDPIGLNYWVETRNAALGNRQYCIDNPKGFGGYGENCWGLSACDTPTGYDAKGAPGWVNDDGTITPTSAVASIPFTPKHAIDFFNFMRTNHPEAWGRYGFPNGYNPGKHWVDPDVIGIDLGMMMTAVENADTGLIWKLSSASPLIQRGYHRLGFVPGSNDGLLAGG